MLARESWGYLTDPKQEQEYAATTNYARSMGDRGEVVACRGERNLATILQLPLGQLLLAI